MKNKGTDDGQTIRRTDGQINVKTRGQTDRQINEMTRGPVDGQTDRQNIARLTAGPMDNQGPGTTVLATVAVLVDFITVLQLLRNCFTR